MPSYKILSFSPTYIYTILVFFLIGCGSPKIPVEEYKPIIRTNPKEADVLYNRGVSLSLLGKNEQASEAFMASVAQNPDDASAWFRLGKVYQELKKENDAQIAYSHAFNIGSFDASHADRGKAYMLLKQYQDSEKEYKQAVEQGTTHIFTALFNLALSCHYQKKYEQAVESYTKAIVLYPKLAQENNLFNNLGAAYQELGNIDKALECYDIGLKYNPQQPDIYWNKAVLFIKQGKIDKALEQAKELGKFDQARAALIFKLNSNKTITE